MIGGVFTDCWMMGSLWFCGLVDVRGVVWLIYDCGVGLLCLCFGVLQEFRALCVFCCWVGWHNAVCFGFEGCGGARVLGDLLCDCGGLLAWFAW